MIFNVVEQIAGTAMAHAAANGAEVPPVTTKLAMIGPQIEATPTAAHDPLAATVFTRLLEI